jgi:hypothetical protein
MVRQLGEIWDAVMGNRHFDGELQTLDSWLVQKVGNRRGSCLARVGRISVLRILGFLLSNLDFTRIRCVQAHDFCSFLLVWEHSNPTIAKFWRNSTGSAIGQGGVRQFTTQQLMICCGGSIWRCSAEITNHTEFLPFIDMPKGKSLF